jgi:hypothetical protein
MENHIANYDHHGNNRKYIDNYCAQPEIPFSTINIIATSKIIYKALLLVKNPLTLAGKHTKHARSIVTTANIQAAKSSER